MTRIYFPLRSNVGYFDVNTPEPTLGARIKEAAVLAEELRFEAGVLDVTVTNDIWAVAHPQGALTREEIEERRRISTTGTPVSIRIGSQGAAGEPAPSHRMREIVSGPLQRAYIAEYESVLVDSTLIDQSWVSYESSDSRDPAVQERSDALKQQLSWPHEPPTLVSHQLLDGRMKKELCDDIAFATGLHSYACVDSIHAPLVHFLADQDSLQSERLSGASALRVLVPDFSEVPWDSVVSWHGRDASAQLRARLSECEQMAISRPLDERDTAILQSANRDLLEGYAKEVKRWPDMTDALLFLMGLAGGDLGVASLFGSGISIPGHEINRRRDADENWRALLYELQRGAEPGS